MLVNNKKNRIIFTVLVIILTYLFLLVFLKLVINFGKETDSSICLFKILFNKECPGCGLTRAFYNMMILNFKKSISFNYKIIIVYPLIWTIYTKFVYNKISLILKGEVKNGRKENKNYKKRRSCS